MKKSYIIAGKLKFSVFGAKIKNGSPVIWNFKFGSDEEASKKLKEMKKSGLYGSLELYKKF